MFGANVGLVIISASNKNIRQIEIKSFSGANYTFFSFNVFLPTYT